MGVIIAANFNRLLGLLLAAGLVAWSGSAYPDLLIGLLIVALVLFGAWRILRLP